MGQLGSEEGPTGVVCPWPTPVDFQENDLDPDPEDLEDLDPEVT
jgi:hypothetical protein